MSITSPKSSSVSPKAHRQESLSPSLEPILTDPSNPRSSSTTTLTVSSNLSSSTRGLSDPLSHQRRMMDALSEYGHSHGPGRRHGLGCITQMGTRKGLSSKEEDLLEQRVLLTPNVVFEGVLDILDRRMSADIPFRKFLDSI